MDYSKNQPLYESEQIQPIEEESMNKDSISQ